MHGIATYRLALAAGFTVDDAATIAIETAGDGPRPRALARRRHLVRDADPPRPHAALPLPVAGDRRSRTSTPTSPAAPATSRSSRSTCTRSRTSASATPRGRTTAAIRASSPTSPARERSRSSPRAPWSARCPASSAARDPRVRGWRPRSSSAWARSCSSRSSSSPTSGTRRTRPRSTSLSTSFSHLADRASEDPRRNTDELWRIYGELKRARAARYGTTGTPDDAAALAAIQDVVTAEDSCAMSNLVNLQVTDSRGGHMSYAEALARRSPRQLDPAEHRRVVHVGRDMDLPTEPCAAGLPGARDQIATLSREGAAAMATINGRLVNATTRATMPDHQIEAWSTDRRRRTPLARATTDKRGTFSLEVTPQSKGVSFRVYREGQPVLDTTGTETWTPDHGDKPIVVAVPDAVDPPRTTPARSSASRGRWRRSSAWPPQTSRSRSGTTTSTGRR